MEKGTGNYMVNSNQNSIFLPSPIRYASISVKKIFENNYRLDASAYDFDVLNALDLIEKNKNGFIPVTDLFSQNYVGNRFKRIYTENPLDIPFFLPSDIENIYPKATKYISNKTETKLDDLKVYKNMILLSCSGTIGKTTIVGKKLDNQIFSHDLIRIKTKDINDLGYVYTFFISGIGQTLLTSNNYGGVIDHIEPEHLNHIPIPITSTEIKCKINKFIQSSFEKREKSNELIDKAQDILYSELNLPAFEDIKPTYYSQNAGFRNFVVNAKDLDKRLDASYHLPEVTTIINILKSNSEKIIKLSDKSIVSNIILPGRFKRVYVDKENGIPFFGGKQLLQLCPSNLKYLSSKYHSERIKNELTIKENMIVVSCSGTIGKVMIAPKHWDGWAINQHCLRIVASSKDYSGYLYAWLDSPYAKPLILRNVYGAVIDELDDVQMSNVIVPILKDKNKIKEINDLVLQANDLRNEAYIEEQKALDIMNNEVLLVKK